MQNLSLKLRSNDSVTICCLNQLGSSLSQTLQIVKELDLRGIKLRSLDEGVEGGTPEGQMMIQLMSYLAHYDWDDSGSREVSESPHRSIRKNPGGRPRSLKDSDVSTLQDMYQNGRPISEITGYLGVSRSTAYNYLKGLKKTP